MTMTRRTKIIATLGPASLIEEMLAKMASRGMNVARINFSHGELETHKKAIDLVRLVNQKYNYQIQILQDLEGPRIRVGNLKKTIELVKGQEIWMSNEAGADANHVPFDFSGEVADIPRLADLFIDDGKLNLRVVGHEGKRIKLKVVQGGPLKARKGINIPDVKLHSDILSEKDRRDIEFGVQERVDFVAQSFVRNKKDIERVTELVKPRLPNCKIVSKIENESGVKNLEKIMEACDGIMIARGDLGVSLPIYQIPVVQKDLILRSIRAGRFSITATQMLESMIENGRPTRAELTDVANAIFDGTDYVMLSGESAVGRYPSRSIKIMNEIIEYTERSDFYKYLGRK